MQQKTWLLFFFRSGIRVQGCSFTASEYMRLHTLQSCYTSPHLYIHIRTYAQIYISPKSTLILLQNIYIFAVTQSLGRSALSHNRFRISSASQANFETKRTITPWSYHRSASQCPKYNRIYFCTFFWPPSPSPQAQTSSHLSSSLVLIQTSPRRILSIR